MKTDPSFESWQHRMRIAKSLPVELGKKIRQKRLVIGLSQETLGAKLGVVGMTVHRWETGKQYPNDRYKHYDRLMAWLNDGEEKSTT